MRKTKKDSSRGRPASELFWIRIKFSARLFSIQAGIFLILLLVLEFFILKSLEREGEIKTRAWSDETAKIYKEINTKNDYRSGLKQIWQTKYYHPKKNVHTKILVLGDSFVWGAAVRNMNDIWWRQLENELEKRNYDIDVLACGMNGWTTNDQLKRARELVRQLSPDLIIWSYVTNDPDESKQLATDLEHRVIQFNTAPFVSHFENDPGLKYIKAMENLLPRIGFYLYNKRKEKLLNELVIPPPVRPLLGYSYNEWELKILEGKNFDLYKKTLDDLAGFLREVDIPSFFITLPHFLDKPFFEKRYQAVEGEFQKRGIPFYNLLPEMVETFKDDPRTKIQWGATPADGHPGVSLTHFYAQKTANYLEKNYGDLLAQVQHKKKEQVVINDVAPFSLKFSQANDSITVLFPKDTSQLYTMPFGRPYIMLNYDKPKPMKQISFTAEGVTNIQIIGEMDNPAVYHLKNMETLIEEEGVARFSKSFNAERRVKSLLITAEFTKGSKRVIILKVGK